MAKHIAYDAAAFDATATVVDAPKTAGIAGFFRRLVDRSRAREAAREEGRIARYIEVHGGELTDDLERQISREFGRQAGWR